MTLGGVTPASGSYDSTCGCVERGTVIISLAGPGSCICGAAANGNVVVNADEIDFFNGDQCGIPLPGGVGRYRWTLSGALLHFAALSDDPCGRTEDLADQNYQRNAPF